MENPYDEEDNAARFQMPAQRGAPGPSDDETLMNASGRDGDDAAARFPVPAQRGTPSPSGDESAQSQMLVQNRVNRIEPKTINQNFDEVMDEDKAVDGANGFEQNLMRNVITVECQKLNGKSFIGTVNYSEAKIKIFQDGMGLDVGLLETVKIHFNNVSVQSNSKINTMHYCTVGKATHNIKGMSQCRMRLC